MKGGKGQAINIILIIISRDYFEMVDNAPLWKYSIFNFKYADHNTAFIIRPIVQRHRYLLIHFCFWKYSFLINVCNTINQLNLKIAVKSESLLNSSILECTVDHTNSQDRRGHSEFVHLASRERTYLGCKSKIKSKISK